MAVHNACDSCNGNGYTPCSCKCKKCDSKGKIKCRNCNNGKVKCAHCSSGKAPCQSCGATGLLVKERLFGSIREDCPVCEGTKRINCTACKGLASLSCSRCHGSGVHTCPLCGGTGRSSQCSKCHGTNRIKCQKCQGTGQLLSMAHDTSYRTWPLERLRFEYEKRQHQVSNLHAQILQIQGTHNQLADERAREYANMETWEQAEQFQIVHGHSEQGYDYRLSQTRNQIQALQNQIKSVEQEMQELENTMNSKWK